MWVGIHTHLKSSYKIVFKPKLRKGFRPTYYLKITFFQLLRETTFLFCRNLCKTCIHIIFFVDISTFFNLSTIAFPLHHVNGDAQLHTTIPSVQLVLTTPAAQRIFTSIENQSFQITTFMLCLIHLIKLSYSTSTEVHPWFQRHQLKIHPF